MAPEGGGVGLAPNRFAQNDRFRTDAAVGRVVTSSLGDQVSGGGEGASGVREERRGQGKGGWVRRNGGWGSGGRRGVKATWEKTNSNDGKRKRKV